MSFLFRKADAEAAADVKENARGLAQKLDGIARRLAESGKLADAGERYLALSGIDRDIQAQSAAAEQDHARMTEKLQDKRRRPLRLIGLGAFFTGLALMVPMVIAAAPVVSLISGIALLLSAGGAVVAFDGVPPGGGQHAPALARDNHAFTSSLKDLQGKTGQHMNAIIRNDVQGLAASPKFEELYDCFPAVRDAFVKASTRASISPPVVRLDKPAGKAPAAANAGL